MSECVIDVNIDEQAVIAAAALGRLRRLGWMAHWANPKEYREAHESLVRETRMLAKLHGEHERHHAAAFDILLECIDALK